MADVSSQGRDAGEGYTKSAVAYRRTRCAICEPKGKDKGRGKG
jgi:hypothetical protein